MYLTPQRLNAIEQSILFGAQLRPLVRKCHHLGFIDPLSYALVQSVDRYCYPAAALLSLTCLRFGDLRKVDLHVYFQGKTQEVRAGKTEQMVRLARLPEETADQRSCIVVPVYPYVTSYGSLRSAINKGITRPVRRILLNSCKVTHVFRHFRASWLKYQGFPDAHISTFLGHRSNESVRSYIHEPLFDLF